MLDNMQIRHNHHTPRFYTVHEAAGILGISAMTLYRSIAANEFPAVRVRNRIVIPARALAEMEAAAITTRSVVDAAEWDSSTRG